MKKRIFSVVLSLILMMQTLTPIIAIENDSDIIVLEETGSEADALDFDEASALDILDGTVEDIVDDIEEETEEAEKDLEAVVSLPEADLETDSLKPSMMSFSASWDGTTETEPEKDEEGVYQIGTAAELAWFRTHVNNTVACDSNAVLTGDIDLGNQSWIPISNRAYVSEHYKGIFNGQYHTISGLYIRSTTYQGLFGRINGATIQNLMVEGDIDCGTSNYVGGIVGQAQASTIENCSFTGLVKGGYSGGIAGSLNSKDSIIKNSVNMGDVTGTYTGGILGYTTGNNTIKNCYNTGTITGSNRSGGIVGQATAGSISNCYNIGAIEGASSTPGGIFSFSNATITNCYYLYPEVENPGGTAVKSMKIENTNSLLSLLDNDAFVDDKDSNGGFPLLSWQTAPDTSPSISLSGDTTIYVQTGVGTSETTLSINLKNIDTSDIDNVTWIVETAKGNSNAGDIVSWQTADNDETHLIVTAKKGGIVTITATVEVSGETLTAARTISVIPQITTAEIVSVNNPGAVAMGQTVQVKVFVLGGEEYDYDNYPLLTYEWRYKSTSSSANIPGATGRTFHIPTIAGYSEWDYLYVEIMSGGAVVKEAQDVRGQLRSEDYGILYPVAYDPGFTLPEKIKDRNLLVLPDTHTVNGVTTNITWSSDNVAIDATTGVVTRPASGTVDVTLTARCEYVTAFANKTFKLTVYSEEAAENESDKSYLQQAVDSLGKWYGPITPVYGKDTNIAAVLKGDLSSKGYGDLSIAVKSITEVYGGAGVAENGDVTYFYTDPNGARGIWFGQYRVTFTLSKGSDNIDVEDLTVNLYWDKSKVEEIMRSEILSGVTEGAILAENNNQDNIISDLVLPKVVNNKKWTQIEWTSSDPSVVFISAENQGSADTLFNPYVGKVIRGAESKEVTLTAKFIFQRTATGQAEIVLYKTFTFTVEALTGAEVDAIREDLLNKLDTGFSNTGLRDYVTGEKLTEIDGIYSTQNDIQLPTTRNFGVDGKYFPITMTSSDNDIMVTPDVANAARVTVYRPPVGDFAKTVTLTVSMTDLAQGVSASKHFTIQVLPLEQAEIDDALALMDRVKTEYFDGLNEGKYTDELSITGGLHSFQEAVWNDSKSGLRWIYDSKETTRNGIIADELDNWAEQEAWRAFRSSDMTILDHETLNYVTQPAEDTFVRINSMLTHEVYGKYAGMPGYEGFDQLYKQPVSVYVMVEGKNHPLRTQEELEQMRDEAILQISAPISVEFTLLGNKPQAMIRTMSLRVQSSSVGDVLVEATVDKLEAGTTVFGLFRKVLAEQGYTYKAVGSYVKSVTDADGNTLSERDGGPNSGWIYTVNGKMPSIYMNGYSLKEDDVVVVRFTNDYTKEDDFNTGDGNNGGGSTGEDSTEDGSDNNHSDSSPEDNAKAEIVTPKNEKDDLNNEVDNILKKLDEERTKTIDRLPETLPTEDRQKTLDEIDRIYSEAVEKIQEADTNEVVTATEDKAVEDLASVLLEVDGETSSTTSDKDETTRSPFMLISVVLALTIVAGTTLAWIGKEKRRKKQ